MWTNERRPQLHIIGILFALDIDFPSIFYEKYNGRKYRYIYGVEADFSASTVSKY